MREFESTFWSVIDGAKRANPSALEKLVKKYRPAVVAFARMQGLEESTAEDVAQEVFLALVHENVLAKADRAKGRFRNLLIKVTRHIILRMRERASAQKRGGGQAVLSLDRVAEGAAEIAAAAAGPREEDQGFDRGWMTNLVDIAMGRMRAECEERGTAYYSMLIAFAHEGKSYRDLAAHAGKTENDIKNVLYIARQKLSEHIHDEIRTYCSSREEYEDEIQYLSRFLRRDR